MDIGFDDNLSEFNRRMQQRVDVLGIAAPKVVHDEAGRLSRTLIQLSGPKNLAKSKRSIEVRARKAFGEMNREGFVTRGGKYGRGDVDWYSWDSGNLRGISKAVDKTHAADDEVYELYNELVYGKTRTQKGMTVVGKRGKQTIKIWEKFTIKKQQMTRLLKKLGAHFGRRQAGWLPAWRILGSPQGSVGSVPQSVLKHESGARGYYLDGLGVKNGPSFTLINTAKGSSKLQAIISQALKIRAKAMAADFRLYINGTKKL